MLSLFPTGFLCIQTGVLESVVEDILESRPPLPGEHAMMDDLRQLEDWHESAWQRLKEHVSYGSSSDSS